MSAVPVEHLPSGRQKIRVLTWLAASVVALAVLLVAGSAFLSLEDRWFLYTVVPTFAVALVSGGLLVTLTPTRRTARSNWPTALLAIAWTTAAAVLGLKLLDSVVDGWTDDDWFAAVVVVLLGGTAVIAISAAMALGSYVAQREALLVVVSAAFLGVSSSVWLTNVPTRARFALSRDALDHHAEAFQGQLELPSPDQPPIELEHERIGQFDLTALGVVDCTYTDGGRVINGVGYRWSGALFIWCPSGPPDEPTIHDGIRRLEDDWYVVFYRDP